MNKEITYSLAAASIFGIVALILAIKLAATRQQTELEGLILTLSILLTTRLSSNGVYSHNPKKSCQRLTLTHQPFRK